MTHNSSERALQSRYKSLIRFIPILVLIVGLVGFLASGGYEYVSLAQLSNHYEWLIGFVAYNAILSGIAYMVFYAVAVAFSIPGGVIFTLVGGLLFGPWVGTVYVVIGATIGACGVFIAARTAFREIFRQRAQVWIARLEEGFRKDAFSYMLVLRLVPLFPFWLVNLVPAFLNVPFRTYALGTLIGIIPGVFVYASVGNGLGTLLEAGDTPDLGIIFQPEILLPILGLAFLAMIPVFYKRVIQTGKFGEES